jgi:hypothetical protein
MGQSWFVETTASRERRDAGDRRSMAKGRDDALDVVIELDQAERAPASGRDAP